MFIFSKKSYQKNFSLSDLNLIWFSSLIYEAKLILSCLCQPRNICNPLTEGISGKETKSLSSIPSHCFTGSNSSCKAFCLQSEACGRSCGGGGTHRLRIEHKVLKKFIIPNLTNKILYFITELWVWQRTVKLQLSL